METSIGRRRLGVGMFLLLLPGWAALACHGCPGRKPSAHDGAVAEAGVASRKTPMPAGLSWPVAQGWRREAFGLPPSWSPKLGVTGWEELRLSPGFARPDAPDAW